MGKRKDRPENPKTLDLVGEEGVDQITEKEGKGFFACYLLTSLSPRHKGHTYIGFTVNPRRRIRQHNGEIRCGAFRTKTKRPWEMVLCIYGFPTNVAALQFEWAWQHPMESLAVRQAAAAFKSFSGFANKIKLAYTMLNLPTWQTLNITVNYFSTKYTCHGALCPSLPRHMKVQIRSMDELPCYTREDGFESENEDSLDADEQQEEAEAIISEIPEIGFLARHSNSASDSQEDIDEIRNDHTGTTENSLENGNSISRIRAVGDAKMSEFVHNHAAELKTRKETGFPCSDLDDDDNQGDLIGKQSTFAAAAAKDQPRQGFRMFGSVHDGAAELKAQKDTESSWCLDLDDDNQGDLIGKQSIFAAAAAKDQPRQGFSMFGSVHDRAAERQARKKTKSSWCLDLDNDNQGDLTGKQSIFTAAATKDRPRQGFTMSGFDHIRAAETKTRKETEFSCGLLNLGEDDHQRDEMETESRNAVADKKDGSRRQDFEMCNEVEVIDLGTPSPSCRVVGLQSKKRRVPEMIIDLTRSPSFIQL